MPEPIQMTAAKEGMAIKSGGIKGILGLDQYDWGGNGGKIWECWKISPCWGNPFDCITCISCLLHFYFCGCCSTWKIWAKSLNIDCAVWPHGLMLCCCPCISSILLRQAIRSKAGVSGNIIGDCVCLYCCGCCACLQHLRSMPAETWSLWPIEIPKIATDCKMMA